LAKFFLLNHFRAGLPTELCRVLNLQSEDELRLNAAVKLDTIEERSLEEAKCAAKFTPQRLLWKTQRMHKLRLFDKIFAHQISLNNLVATIKTNNRVLKIKTGPGNRMPATTETGMDKPAFFARCRASDRKSAARE
jgi:hypothetical protein